MNGMNGGVVAFRRSGRHAGGNLDTKSESLDNSKKNAGWRRLPLMAPPLLLPLLLGAASAATPLNVITVLTDDQGFGDTGHTCDNSTGMCALTPNIDAMARSNHSAVFHRFYSAAGVCSPTRAALL